MSETPNEFNSLTKMFNCSLKKLEPGTGYCVISVTEMIVTARTRLVSKLLQF